MTDYTAIPVLDITDWIVAQAFATGVLNASDYTLPDASVMKPMVPVQQLPETNNEIQAHGFMVYDVQPLRYPANGEDYWTCREQLTITCYSNDYLKVLGMQMLLVDLLRRKDLTARDINAAGTSSGKNKFLKFDVMGSLPPDPAAEENGRFGSSIIVEYDYTRSIGNDGRFNV